MELDSVAAAPDIVGLVELGSGSMAADIAGLDMAAPSLAVDELPPEDCIFPSLAQPPTITPKNVIQIAFLSMSLPPVKCVLTPFTLGEAKKKGKEKRTRYSLNTFVPTSN